MYPFQRNFCTFFFFCHWAFFVDIKTFFVSLDYRWGIGKKPFSNPAAAAPAKLSESFRETLAKTLCDRGYAGRKKKGKEKNSAVQLAGEEKKIQRKEKLEAQRTVSQTTQCSRISVLTTTRIHFGVMSTISRCMQALRRLWHNGKGWRVRNSYMTSRLTGM